MNFLIDTHTHFDVSEYDAHRQHYVQSALKNGVAHIVLIGLTARRFKTMQMIAAEVNGYCFETLPLKKLGCHLAMGLHPLYVNEHSMDDLVVLDNYLTTVPNIAIAEIGLDTYLPFLKQADVYDKQQRLFAEQLRLATFHQLPVLLHIRKSHSDTLKILKAERYNAHHQGGIAHAFSGGEQEGLAFVKLGFKLGVTGQITNPNAKKLHRTIRSAVEYAGLACLVIETDCPDMMPLPCQHKGRMNEPANLSYVLDALASILAVDKDKLAEQLWENSGQAFRYEF